VWLQRFKIKIHKGIRHWQTRTQVPSYLEERNNRAGSVQSITNIEATFRDAHDLEDPYTIMDGGIDHMMLADPFSSKPSTTRLLKSETNFY